MNQRIEIVVGMAFGDEGKGTVVDYLARKRTNPLVVRFNGGAQAGHNVVLPDGRSHTFSQWGAGTFAGASTLFSKHCLIDPIAMLNEAAHLREVGIADPFALLSVDPDCLVVTPVHKAANRLRELARGVDRHGSCGMGINEAVSDALKNPTYAVRARDLRDPELLLYKFVFSANWKAAELHDLNLSNEEFHGVFPDTKAMGDWCDSIAAWMPPLRLADTSDTVRAHDGDLIFEGAQGILLDEDVGFFPHVTRSKTTSANALAILKVAGLDYLQAKTIGVMRAYMTRHGEGPFPTESKKLKTKLWDPNNGDDGPQGPLRYGWPDFALLQYALACDAIDALAVTCLDQWDSVREESSYYDDYRVDVSLIAKGKKFPEFVVPMFSGGGISSEKYVTKIEDALERPVEILSYGPTFADKRSHARADDLLPR